MYDASSGFHNIKDFNMILHSRILSDRILATHEEPKSILSSFPSILFIHGLFGSLDNLGGIARPFRDSYKCIQIDVRNHGLSPRSDAMSYRSMARDMLDTLNALGIDDVIVVGHSMGGKIAMAMTALAPTRVKQLVIIDIAPVRYDERRHDDVFEAIKAVNDSGVTTRKNAEEIMASYMTEKPVIQFILKSFSEGEWKFNVPALWKNYENISGWEAIPAWVGPALFIRGERSSYLDQRYRSELLAQFPKAQGHIIAGAGHWVHAEKSDAVIRTVKRFLTIKN